MVNKAINTRLEEIKNSVLALVENQTIDLTQKNIKMQPLVEEKKVLENCLKELEIIKRKTYTGKC